MTARRGWMWLLAFALVAAQALGFMHRLVHSPQAAAAHEVAAHQAGGDGNDHGQDNRWVAGLFSGHDSEGSTCRLFDALSHDIAPAIAITALPALLLPIFLQWAQGEALVRWAALFDARGPPSLR
jgi:hypothetical protein